MNLTQRVRPSYYESIERQLRDIFAAIIFEPLVKVLKEVTDQMKPKEFLNADQSVLRRALRSGRVQYADGIFSGHFSAEIGKAIRSFGGEFDSRKKIYRVSAEDLPPWVKAEAGVYQSVAREAHDQIKRTLGYIDSALDQSVKKHLIDPEKSLAKIEGDFIPAAKAIEVSPKLNDASRDKLRKEYTESMRLCIENFSREETQEIRQLVERNAMEGYRFDSLIARIQRRHDVAKTKAAFLARNETSLFMSNFRKERFSEGGVTQYRWSTSHDSRVRDDHKDLDGTLQFYDSPPIADKRSGKRANPGGIWNCRCVDIPVLKGIRLAA